MRRFAWRTWGCDGGHLLHQRFDTPEQAGEWRREHFPNVEDADLTLVAVEHGERRQVSPTEMAAAHRAWLWQGDGRALLVDCPSCCARSGEPCAPFSLDRPHLSRQELADETAPAAP